jgi:hypothetical protein
MFSFFVSTLSLFIVHKSSQGGAFGNILLLLSLWHWNQGPTFILLASNLFCFTIHRTFHNVVLSFL